MSEANKMARTDVSYAVHVADLSAALSCNSTEGDPRTALSRLPADGLAQAMSFLSQRSVTRSVRTLAAVSPQMRLDAEVLMRLPNCCEEVSRVRVEEKQLVYAVAATEQTRSRTQLEHSLWWACRCKLPLVLDVDNSRNNLSLLLTDHLKSQVKALSVQVLAPTKCMRDSAQSTCDEQCGTFLCALSTFPRLSKLSIACRTVAGGGLLASALNRTLRVAAQMSITEVELCGFTHLHGLSSLAGAQYLWRLSAKHCGLQSVSDLAKCPMLTMLDVSHNRHLETLAGLAGAARLEGLAARNCQLQNVDGLCYCPELRDVDVAGNTTLEHLHGLAGAPCLMKVVASCCGLRSVGGLNYCPCLCEVDVSYNKHLDDITGLAGARNLRRVCASGCELRSVDGLGVCPRLSELNVSSNGSLEDLVGLEGAPSLKKVNAVKCGLRRVGGLAKCPQLLELTVHYNTLLVDLCGLGGAPCLEKITAWSCGLRRVDGLGSCPRLCELELSGNKTLEDLGDLAASTSLRRLNVSGSPIADTHLFGALVEVTR